MNELKRMIAASTALDSDIWALASQRREVVVSKDADFVSLALTSENGQHFVWVSMGNTRREALLERMVNAMPQIIAALDADERIVEIS